ncbi:hypothetical protein [Pseudomonas asiatica]|uniref:hypothetical protein n=1 Tax=Pseudomonas asiatica TaxID=2219225 RepID=UPI0010C15416|nr:hypothetical protein [Pseudomonas asiatica]
MKPEVEALPEADQSLATPVSPLNKAVRLVLLAVLFFFAACFVSNCILSYSDVIPVSQYDLDNASWVGLSPLGFAHFINILSVLAALYSLFSIAITQRLLVALVSGLVAACLTVSSLPGNSLRLGALNGDARIGCFSYQSLECREMLSAPTEGFPSIYSGDQNAVGYGRYAPWFQEVLATVKPKINSNISSAIPGVAFLKAPWILAHAAEINATLDAQRDELKRIRSSSALP